MPMPYSVKPLKRLAGMNSGEDPPSSRAGSSAPARDDATLTCCEPRQAVLQPPWPLQAVWPLQAFLSVWQPPRPLQAFWPLQACLLGSLACILVPAPPSSWLAQPVVPMMRPPNAAVAIKALAEFFMLSPVGLVGFWLRRESCRPTYDDTIATSDSILNHSTALRRIWILRRSREISGPRSTADRLNSPEFSLVRVRPSVHTAPK